MIRDQVLLASRVAFSPARDNAVAKAILFGWQGSKQYTFGVMADYSATVAAVKTVTFYKGTGTDKTGPVQTVTLSRGSTDTAVASTAFQYAIAETMYQKAAVAAGTALAAGTIPTNTWGIYLFTINAAGTITSTAGAANFTTGYATEAAAIAALPATPDGSASMGYVTVQTKVGSPFIGGTDGLAGGASGNVANATNYTSTASIAPATQVGAPLRWDFTAGPLYLSLPGALASDDHGSLGVELEASGSGGTTGRVQIFGFSG